MGFIGVMLLLPVGQPINHVPGFDLLYFAFVCIISFLCYRFAHIRQGRFNARKPIMLFITRQWSDHNKNG